METYREENPQTLHGRNEPRKWSGRSENLLLNSTGWNTTQFPAAAEVFLLTFPFIELTRTFMNNRRRLARFWFLQYEP
jgi:hypothetical protein